MAITLVKQPTPVAVSMSALLASTWGGMDQARQGTHGGVTGITTGIVAVDRETSGWQPGDLDVIAARTNVGKSSMSLHMALAAANGGKPTLFVPLEMTREACALRIIAAHARLDERALRTGQASVADYSAVARCIDELRTIPLFWLEPRRLTLEGLRAVIVEQQEANGCELVFVDQLGNLKPTNTRESRVWQVAELTGGLKELARELGVAIVVCHQINRESEHNGQDRRPELWHLRDSGAVEQDSDVVLLMHRTWVPGQNQQSGPVELTVAKNRRGRRVSVQLMYHGPQTRFEETTA